MLAFSILWVVLASAVVALATARKFAAHEEDDYLSVGDSESTKIGQQAVVARHLDTIDRWGKVFTAAAIVYGLVLFSGFLYVGWQNGQQMLK